MPKEPVHIDLPDLSTTDSKKKSHSDFYDKEETVGTEEKTEDEQKSLITTKLEELKDNLQSRDSHI